MEEVEELGRGRGSGSGRSETQAREHTVVAQRAPGAAATTRQHCMNAGTKQPVCIHTNDSVNIADADNVVCNPAETLLPL